jgi:hypothetical protein
MTAPPETLHLLRFWSFGQAQVHVALLGRTQTR